ncbi:MAG: hypothetical protein AAF821_09990 [Cyanobacteria bacterium P01_D01_bin.156]
MPKPPNSNLIGCLTLLAASGTASLDAVYAAEALPDGDTHADASNLNHAEPTNSLEPGEVIRTHAQTLNPDDSSQPVFISHSDRLGDTTLNNHVALEKEDTTQSEKLQWLIQTATRDTSTNSNLLAERRTASSGVLEGEPTSQIFEPTGLDARVNQDEIELSVTDHASTDNLAETAETLHSTIARSEESILASPELLILSIEQEQIVEPPVLSVEPESLSSYTVDGTSPDTVDTPVVTSAQSLTAEYTEEPVLVTDTPAQLRTSAALETDVIAQLPIEPPLPGGRPDEATEQLLDELFQAGETIRENSGYSSSPSVTISNPSGFGADNRTAFIGVGYQERTRFANKDDGGLVVGVGLGDARDNVGVQLSYTVASFGGSRDFGAGGFNAKLHKRLAEDWSVALGWEGFITTADVVDFEDSIYGSVSHIIRTRDSITQPFSRVALTAGVGNGRFRTEDDVFDDRDSIGVFGSVAVRVDEPVSAIVEWTGQDLAVGLSITPFKDVPLVILPAVRDIAGAGDGGRFVMGAGFSFRF